MSAGLVQMPSGLFVPEYAAEEIAMAQRRQKGVDVFAGCGGASLGFIQAGFEVVAAIEHDPNAVMTYMANLCRWGQVKVWFVEERDEQRMENAVQAMFKRQKKNRAGSQLEFPLAGNGWIATKPGAPGVSHVIVGDVRKLSGARLLEIIGLRKGELGCMFGGPPCQGFSYANGKRCPEDPRNSLVFEFARLIIETMPVTMVMENVPGILTMKTGDGVPVVERFCQILRDGGFHGVEAFEQALKRPGAAGGMQRSTKPRRAGKKKQDADDDEESE